MLKKPNMNNETAFLKERIKELEKENAIKFTKDGGVVTILSATDKNELTVTITDNGVGISKDRIDTLFSINEGYSTPGTKKEKGTGLGLILCKEFIEKHHGKIKVESNVGIGSFFSFSLPTTD